MDRSTPLPPPTPFVPPPPPAHPVVGCPANFSCFGPGQGKAFLTALDAATCGDSLALIGTEDAPAVLSAEMSTRNGRQVPFNLESSAGTRVLFRDAVITGQHRFWISGPAVFERVTFANSSGASGGMGGDGSNGGLLTVATEHTVEITNCTFRNGKAQIGGCLSNYVGRMVVRGLSR